MTLLLKDFIFRLTENGIKGMAGLPHYSTENRLTCPNNTFHELLLLLFFFMFHHKALKNYCSVFHSLASIVPGDKVPVLPLQ